MSPSQSLSVAIECPRQSYRSYQEIFFFVHLSHSQHQTYKEKSSSPPGYPPFQPHFFTSQYQTYKIQRTKKKTLLLPGFPPPFQPHLHLTIPNIQNTENKDKNSSPPRIPPPLLASSSPHNPIPILRTDFLSIFVCYYHMIRPNLIF